MKDGDILCLENTRFHKGEEKNDPAFVAALAKLGDIYVNDAFSAAHRAHASTEGLGHKLPAYAGRTMQAELEALSKALEAPTAAGGRDHRRRQDVHQARPARKISCRKVDALVIGGGMANTFLHAQGKASANRWPSATSPIPRATSSKPPRRRTARSSCRSMPWWRSNSRPMRRRSAYGLDAIPADGMILDIGPQSIKRVQAALDDAEDPGLERPARRLRAAALRQRNRGGRDATPPNAQKPESWSQSRAAATPWRRSTRPASPIDFTYVSTAGGAFLEWMEGKPLPGVEVLRAK